MKNFDKRADSKKKVFVSYEKYKNIMLYLNQNLFPHHHSYRRPRLPQIHLRFRQSFSSLTLFSAPVK